MLAAPSIAGIVKVLPKQLQTTTDAGQTPAYRKLLTRTREGGNVEKNRGLRGNGGRDEDLRAAVQLDKSQLLVAKTNKEINIHRWIAAR